jgi:phosphoheptose isomerase
MSSKVPRGTYSHAHVTALTAALGALDDQVARAEAWGRRLATVLPAGGRLLVAGNGGSAAQAQHLAAELVGRYTADRPPYSAIALHTDTSTLTALLNDFGPTEVFARSVRAHGRRGDVLLSISTSGASENVLAATAAARESGLVTWALTGGCPNPLASASDDVVAFRAARTATVQELHLVAIHVLCAAFDATVLELQTTLDTLGPATEAP